MFHIGMGNESLLIFFVILSLRLFSPPGLQKRVSMEGHLIMYKLATCAPFTPDLSNGATIIQRSFGNCGCQRRLGIPRG